MKRLLDFCANKGNSSTTLIIVTRTSQNGEG
jgi:hypothetical protein